MYAVSYDFNSRKNVTVNIIHVFNKMFLIIMSPSTFAEPWRLQLPQLRTAAVVRVTRASSHNGNVLRRRLRDVAHGNRRLRRRLRRPDRRSRHPFITAPFHQREGRIGRKQRHGRRGEERDGSQFDAPSGDVRRGRHRRRRWTDFHGQRPQQPNTVLLIASDDGRRCRRMWRVLVVELWLVLRIGVLVFVGDVPPTPGQVYIWQIFLTYAFVSFYTNQFWKNYLLAHFTNSNLHQNLTAKKKSYCRCALL